MLTLLRTLGFIVRHPLNRGRPLKALSSFIRWQVGSRMVPGAVAIPFVQGTRLLTKRGMTGATGNIYCGLHEFEDMGFVLHALCEGDLFIDVGANVGSYTVLAAGACGAAVIAVEPVPSTYRCLRDNIRLNGLDELVIPRNIGLGATRGTLRFTGTLDTVNHVLSPGESAVDGGIEVPVETLDSLLDGRTATIIKIDVEGFETEVLRGAEKTLHDPGLLAVLMELNGAGSRYGFDDDALHRQVVDLGFVPCAYDPLTRSLSTLSDRNTAAGNTLYVKDVAAIEARVGAAPSRAVGGGSV